MTPQPFLENYTPYGSNIVAVKKLLAHICAFLRKKKVVDKHMEFAAYKTEPVNACNFLRNEDI
jgi:hypothetical protein